MAARAVTVRSRKGESEEAQSIRRQLHDKMRMSSASQALFDGAQRGDLRKVVNALNARGDPNCANQGGYTALMLAVGGGHREIVALVLQANSNPNYAIAGLTPLMIASASGQLEVARMLINCGASSTTIEQRHGWTALHRASERGHAELVGLLVQAGGSIDAADWKGYTPLMLAMEAGHVDTSRTLLCAGASLGIVDQRGENAMMKCVLRGQDECLDLFLKVGAPINTSAKTSGDTLLIAAARLGQEATCRRILQFKGNVNLANLKRESPLMIAAQGGYQNIVHMLLLAGADTTYRDLEGHTALMCAAADGKAQICALMLDFGADPSASSSIDHETPATLAARHGHMDVYKVLEAAGSVVGAVGSASQITFENELSRHKPIAAM
eukprot:TRINITY_DN63959_c0_g1_i1.p1 TRINITY_DN63959_c0_g1~~TRINITY_DN63959_c0_g1_i1.p1  ORF type:complete len:423 (+),score=70.80 TRINITY_DN63959_c0_g1_i1:118-1269(+)